MPKTYCILTGPPFRMQAAFLSERAGLMGAGCRSSIAKVGFSIFSGEISCHIGFYNSVIPPISKTCWCAKWNQALEVPNDCLKAHSRN